MTDRRWPALTWTIPLVFALAYALWPILGMPRPHYAPETREILFGQKPQDIMTMGWYGRVLMAALVALVLGAPAGWLISRRAPSWQRLGPWIAAAVVLLAMIIAAVREIVHWMLA